MVAAEGVWGGAGVASFAFASPVDGDGLGGGECDGDVEQDAAPYDVGCPAVCCCCVHRVCPFVCVTCGDVLTIAQWAAIVQPMDEYEKAQFDAARLRLLLRLRYAQILWSDPEPPGLRVDTSVYSDDPFGEDRPY